MPLKHKTMLLRGLSFKDAQLQDVMHQVAAQLQDAQLKDVIHQAAAQLQDVLQQDVALAPVAKAAAAAKKGNNVFLLTLLIHIQDNK